MACRSRPMSANVKALGLLSTHSWNVISATDFALTAEPPDVGVWWPAWQNTADRQVWYIRCKVQKYFSGRSGRKQAKAIPNYFDAPLVSPTRFQNILSLRRIAPPNCPHCFFGPEGPAKAIKYFELDLPLCW